MYHYILIFFLIAFFNPALAEKIQDIKIDVSGSARVRAEGTDNRDFGSAYDKNDFTGNRFRLGFDISTNEQTSFYLEFQHSNVWGGSSGKTVDESNSVHQAFILYKINESLLFKVGRQELLYGDQLLVGPVGWSNVGRSFDAYKTKWSHSLGWLDIFVADVTKGSGASTSNNHFFLWDI